MGLLQRYELPCPAPCLKDDPPACETGRFASSAVPRIAWNGIEVGLAKYIIALYTADEIGEGPQGVSRWRIVVRQPVSVAWPGAVHSVRILVPKELPGLTQDRACPWRKL